MFQRLREIVGRPVFGRDGVILSLRFFKQRVEAPLEIDCRVGDIRHHSPPVSLIVKRSEKRKSGRQFFGDYALDDTARAA